MATVERKVTVCDRCNMASRKMFRNLIEFSDLDEDGNLKPEPSMVRYALELCPACHRRMKKFLAKAVS